MIEFQVLIFCNSLSFDFMNQYIFYFFSEAFIVLILGVEIHIGFTLCK